MVLVRVYAEDPFLTFFLYCSSVSYIEQLTVEALPFLWTPGVISCSVTLEVGCHESLLLETQHT